MGLMKEIQRWIAKQRVITGFNINMKAISKSTSISLKLKYILSDIQRAV